MRNPLRTEAEAFGFVLVAAACFCALALAAALGGARVAAAAFLALALGIGVGVFMRSEPRRREPAVWEREPDDGRRRILVVAGEALEAEPLRDEVLRRVEGQDAEVLVVAPGLERDGRWSADGDEARSAAAGRVDEAVAALRNAGVDASGTVGDADALRAVREALRTFRADEVVISAELPR